jgi:acyl carrier protein
MDTLNSKLAEILEVDSVQAGDVLSDFEVWDSLTRLSILAMLDSRYGVNLAAADLKRLHTVGDLLAAVEARRPAPAKT